jgi:3-oxoacyl-(acyl-carrier-protein) synthase
MVAAADEWTPMLSARYRELGLLAGGSGGAGTGCMGGEGAAALVLRRVKPGSGAIPSGWAVIEGTAFAGDTTAAPDPDGRAHGRAIRTAIRRSGTTPDEIDFAVGQGCGWRAHDQREHAALRAVCPNIPLESVVQRTGMLESAGGLFAAMAAAHALRSRPGLRRALLIGSTERGAHAALVLSRIAA